MITITLNTGMSIRIYQTAKIEIINRRGEVLDETLCPEHLRDAIKSVYRADSEMLVKQNHTPKPMPEYYQVPNAALLRKSMEANMKHWASLSLEEQNMSLAGKAKGGSNDYDKK